MRNRLHAIFFALIFVAGIYLRASDLFAPWKGVHNAWGSEFECYHHSLIFLAAAWMCFFARDLFKKQLRESDWLLLVLLGYGVLHTKFPRIRQDDPIIYALSAQSSN